MGATGSGKSTLLQCAAGSGWSARTSLECAKVR
ncbi:hypothetical protein ACLQ28_14135 [Micromonospora sp. DT201]